MTTTNSQSSNYSEDIVTKFQDLEADRTYTVKGFKAIDSKFGKSFILKVLEDRKDDCIKIWSSPKINEYIKHEKLEKKPKKFTFTTKRTTSGKYCGMLYAEIHGYNDSVDSGFIELE